MRKAVRRSVRARRESVERALEQICRPILWRNGSYLEANLNEFGRLLRGAQKEGRAGAYAAALAGWASRLAGPDWPVVGPILQGVSDPVEARLLRGALKRGVARGSAGSLAVDACLALAARAPLAARLADLLRLEAAHPEMLSARPLAAALAALPQVPGEPPAAPSRALEAVARASRSCLFCVLGPGVSLKDVAAVTPRGARVIAGAYQPSKSIIEAWLLEARDPGLGLNVTVIDTLQDDADLNGDAHRWLSGVADRIAGKALAEPAWAPLRERGGFWLRHAESAELRLSDRLFAWFRIHSAFAGAVAKCDVSGVCLMGVLADIAPIRATVARLLPGVPVLEAHTGRSLSELSRRATRAEPVLPDDCALDTTGLYLAVENARQDAVAAAAALVPRPIGVALGAGGRLYGPAMQALVEALGPDVVRIDSLLTPAVPFRPTVAVGRSAVGRWMSGSTRMALARRTGLDSATLNGRIGNLVGTFLAGDLSALLLADAASSAAASVLAPRFAVVLPTRSPILRVAARNLQVAGAVVHEAQVVYLSRMARYRAPVADLFHALDTHSAAQMATDFGLDPGAIRVGGSLRGGPGVVVRRRNGPAPLRITLASQPEMLERSLERLDAVLEALGGLELDWYLALRPHPAESDLRVNAYRTRLVDAGVPVRLDGPLEETDLLISGFSNLVLEAAVSEIRSVVYWPSPEPPPVPYERMGLALQAGSVGELSRLIADCHAEGPLIRELDRTRANYLRLNPLLGGGAAEAMVRVIRASAGN